MRPDAVGSSRGSLANVGVLAEREASGGWQAREEPEPAHENGGRGAQPQQRALRAGPAGARPTRDPADNRGEPSHGRHAARAEAEQIGNCRGVRGQRERWHDPQQMGAASESVQRSDRHGRMAVTVVLVVVPVTPRAGMVVPPEGASNAPDPDGDQDQAHGQLAVGGQGIDRQRMARQQYQEPHAEHAGAVAQPPADARLPAPGPVRDGIGRDRGQVIRARQHVHHAGRQSCEGESHAACSALRSALASSLRERGVSRSFQLAKASSTARCGRLPMPMKKAAAWSAYASGRRASKQLVGRRRTFRFAQRRLALATRGQDLRVDGAVFGIVRGLEQRRDERQGDVQLSARERHLGAMPPSRHVLPAGSRRARPRSPPPGRDRRGASRSRPIRRAVGRTGRATRHCPHRARPHSRFRPPPIDPFPPAATRAHQACESRDRPSPVRSRRTSASPYRPVAWSSAALSTSISRAGYAGGER